MSLQQLESLVQKIKSAPVDPTASLGRRRGAMEKTAFRLDADIKAEPVSAGGVPAEWITAPGADQGRNVLYLHGGGYMIGSIKTHRCLAGWVSRAAQARVLIIDYRLAPENPCPAAVDDAVAAYRFMLDSGVDSSRTVIAGDSAGGGLTVATLLAIRDAKLPLPAAAVCLSPWVDMEGTGESMTTKAAADPMVGSGNLGEMAAAYLVARIPGLLLRRRFMPTSRVCRQCSSRSARPKSCSTTRSGWRNVPVRPGWKSFTNRGRT